MLERDLRDDNIGRESNCRYKKRKAHEGKSRIIKCLQFPKHPDISDV